MIGPDENADRSPAAGEDRRQGRHLFWPSRPLHVAGPALLLLAAALAIAPQIIRGNSCGHDFDFHLVSWIDCFHAWRHGVLYPHWAPDANYGAGEPRFVFYPPLTWMLGAAAALVLPWPFVPVAVTFVLLAATGLGVWMLARHTLAEAPAVLAGCAAIFSGYALFCAYERAAFGELAGGFWIPVLLLFALRDRRPAGSAARRAFDGSAAPLALALAGAWLSNDPVGMMASYLLAGVSLASAWLQRSWAPLLRAATATAMALGLTAFYLLPAAVEQRWADVRQLIDDPSGMIENSFLFGRHADPQLASHDYELHRISLIAASMIAVAFLSFLIARLRGAMSGSRSWWAALALIAPAILLLQLPVSLPLWNLLPKLRFLQFSWRWLVALEAPMAIFFAAAVWPRAHARRWRFAAAGAVCALLFLAAAAFARRSFFQTCADGDSVAAMMNAYRSGEGFDGANEYAPPGTDDSLLAISLPDSCLVSDPSIPLGKPDEDGVLVWDPGQPGCEATFPAQTLCSRAHPDDLRMHAVLPHSGYLILRRRAFPAWRVWVNGQALDALPRRADGLMAIPVPGGAVDLAVNWTTTPDVTAGRWLSLLSLLLVTSVCLLERRLARGALS